MSFLIEYNYYITKPPLKHPQTKTIIMKILEIYIKKLRFKKPIIGSKVKITNFTKK